jgi:cysteine synthase
MDPQLPAVGVCAGAGSGGHASVVAVLIRARHKEGAIITFVDPEPSDAVMVGEGHASFVAVLL